jgi:hypothetical protein
MLVDLEQGDRGHAAEPGQHALVLKRRRIVKGVVEDDGAIPAMGAYRWDRRIEVDHLLGNLRAQPVSDLLDAEPLDDSDTHGQRHHGAPEA